MVDVGICPDAHDRRDPRVAAVVASHVETLGRGRKGRVRHAGSKDQHRALEATLLRGRVARERRRVDEHLARALHQDRAAERRRVVLELTLGEKQRAALERQRTATERRRVVAEQAAAEQHRRLPDVPRARWRHVEGAAELAGVVDKVAVGEGGDRVGARARRDRRVHDDALGRQVCLPQIDRRTKVHVLEARVGEDGRQLAGTFG